MESLEDLIKKILDGAQKEGAPKRKVIENALRRFARSYKTCPNEEEKIGEDNGAYNFIRTIFPDDLTSQQIYLDFYDTHKKKIC